MVYELRFGMKY